MLVLLLALYLYATCTERRKKRTRSPIVGEDEPLSNGTVNSSDLEKGVTKADDDDFMVRLFNTGACKVSLTMYHAGCVVTASRQIR